jgi:hypothetical protein
MTNKYEVDYAINHGVEISAMKGTQDRNEEQQVDSSTTNLPAVIDYGDYEGAGSENVGADDFVIPLVRILHYQCPEILPASQGGVDGARPGMILNTATREVFDAAVGIPFIPCDYKRDYVEWIPRRNPDTGETQSGGFVGRRSVDDPMVLALKEEHGDFKPLPTPEGHELVETRYLYSLLLHDGTFDQVIIPFSSTKIQCVKRFWGKYTNIKYPNSKGVRVRPPLWAHQWRLKTLSNPKAKQGQAHFIYEIVLDKPGDSIRSRLDRTDPMYQEGIDFFEMIRAGTVRAATPEMESRNGDADDIPF